MTYSILDLGKVTVDAYTKDETDTLLDDKQDTLISGTNIKTINNTSLLGSGNIEISGSGKSIYYGVCNDAADIVAKTIECEDFVLENGAMIAVSFSNGNTSIKTKLNVNGTGNKSIAFSDGYVGNDQRFRFGYNTTVLFVYNGNAYFPQGYDKLPSLTAFASSSTAANEAAKVATCDSDIVASSALYAVRFTYANTVEGRLTMSINGGTGGPIFYKGVVTSSNNPLLWGAGDTLLFAYIQTSGAYVCIGNPATAPSIEPATDNVAGTVKTNAAESITLNADGQLTVGGRLGQFPSGGVFYPSTIEPTNVGASTFLMTDGAKNLSLGPRNFGIMAGASLTCRNAVAGVTQYRVQNTQGNRFICYAVKGGRVALDQNDATTNGTALITNITFANGNPIAAYYGPTEVANDIIITVDRTVNPSAATTKLRVYGTSTSSDVIIVGQGNGATGGKAISLGQSCFAGGNQCIAFGNSSISTGNNSVAFGHTHLVTKQFCLAAGQGHDFTNASNGVTAVGIASSIVSNTLFAVGNGTFNGNGDIVRSNAFEVTSDGGIVLKSPNGTRYKITVDDTGNLTTTAI